MKLWAKFTLIFSVIVIFGGGFTVLYLSTVFLEQFRISEETHLLSVAEMSKEAYLAYTKNNGIRAVDWSSDGYIRNTTEALVNPSTPAKKKKELAQEFGEYLRTSKMIFDPNVLITDLINGEGIVIASSRDERIGTNELEEEREHNVAKISEALLGGLGKAYVSTMVTESDEDAGPMNHVTARIFSTSIDRDQKVLPLDAILLVHFAASAAPTSFLGGMGHENDGHADAKVFTSRYGSGEIYLARTSDGAVLTAPRAGKEGVVLSSHVDLNIAKDCLEKGEDFHGEYANYEGITVMGSMECIEEGNTMLIAEVAKSESLAPFYDMQKKIIFAILSVLLFIVLFSIFISRSILSPLNEIVLVAAQVAKKDLTARIKIKSKDEIGQVAVVFNQMLDNIVQYQKDVAASAKELSEKVASIEKQNVFLKDVRKAMLNLLQDSWNLGATLKKEQERSMSIITSMNEGLLVVDAERKITLMNPTAEKLLETKQEDVLGKDVGTLWRMFQGERELEGEERFIARTLSTRQSLAVSVEDNIFIQVASGRKFPIVVATTLLAAKDIEGVLVVFRDVTEEKALNDAKSNFISIASHQLRTPLTSIRWYSEVLSDGSMGALNKEQADFLNEIYQGSIRLFKTIDTLLALSRVESGKFEEHPVELDVKVFAEGVVKEVDPLLQEKKMVTHIDAEENLPNIFVDAFMLKEVLTNLVANSIRYTNEGGAIDLYFKKGDGNVVCSVHDNGIGIPDDQKEKIFNRFFRADNAVSKVPDGSGLGLSLVKELVEKWGGKVWFESKEGEGATFFITIPVSSGATTA